MNQQTGPKADDFYVGYLPLPASHARTLRVAVPAIALVCAGAAVLVAAWQRDPGAAVWQEETTHIRGVLLDDPYPLILTPQGHVVLLVEQGKHGAWGRVGEWRGQAVVAHGLEIKRDGRTILELAAGADAISLDPDAVPAPLPQAVDPRAVTLVGEVIDSKCYHGAMKPGEGKTHKACATLCISNGIPAMFMDESGAAYLFTTGRGVPDDDTLSKIGEPVQVTGEVSAVGEMRVLRALPGSVHRVRK